jgi:hypothetical protein
MCKKTHDIIGILTVFFIAAFLTHSAPAMTKEEIIREIKYTVDSNEGVLDYIQELKKQTDTDGKEFYAYTDGKQEINLEDLDGNKLEELLNKVYIQVNAYQAQIVAQQMQAAREAQKASSIQQQMPRTPPQPPRMPAPPPGPPKR